MFIPFLEFFFSFLFNLKKEQSGEWESFEGNFAKCGPGQRKNLVGGILEFRLSYSVIVPSLSEE